MGFCPDFINFHLLPYLEILKKRGIRIVSNAGGINPKSCEAALRKLCQEKNVQLSIATVVGDDLISQVSRLTIIVEFKMIFLLRLERQMEVMSIDGNGSNSV